MKAMAPTRSTELHQCRFRLPANPTAAGQARTKVREAIAAWEIEIDADAAVLLTSELVTNAVTHDGGDVITLAISCCSCQLRVDVHDSSTTLPSPACVAPFDAETGRGLMLVDTLADQWGYYRTSAGKGVYFTLTFPSALSRDDA
jgi:anti-sigma regulatory factor (Ser/Thr protein kinase)